MRAKTKSASYQAHTCSLVIAAVLWCVASHQAIAARSVDKKICREIAQGYAQIKTGASTVERSRTLFSAASRGCEKLALQVIADGGSLRSRNRSGLMPLSVAAAEGWIALVRLFLDRDAPIDARGVFGSTALFRAAAADRLDVVRELVERGADVHIRGRKANTVISAAAYMGNPEMVSLLLKKGADPLLVDQFGKSAMCYAAGRGFDDVVSVLLDGGVDVNARYGNGLSALMWAAGHSVDAGNNSAIRVIKLVTARGAQIDARDNRGRTALMIAAELGYEEVVDALLGHGADPSLVDNSGKTPHDLATTESLRTRLATTR